MQRSSAPSPASSSVWLPVIFLLCGLAFRAVKLRMGAADFAPNVAPWMALAFTGAIVFPRALAWWVWPVVLVAFDLLVQPGDRLEILGQIWLVYVCLAAAALWGGSRRGRIGVLGALGGVLTCSLGFYLITNTQAWAVSAEYAKTFSGWLQALTTGVPGPWPPTWAFLRNSLLSDLGFSLLLLIGYNAEAMLRRLRQIPWRRETLAAA